MKYFAILFISLLAFSSCKKQGTEISLNSESSDGTSIEGTWKMVEFQCFCPPIPDLSNESILWSFDLETNTLTVQNPVEDEYPFILISGIYDFEITDDQITIDSIQYDYILIETELEISDHPEVDGPLMRFEME